MTLIFIINGENCPVEMDEDEPMWRWRDVVLRVSANTGRPPGEWEIRNEKGVLLTWWETPSELEMADPSRVFLTLRVGAGGVADENSRANRRDAGSCHVAVGVRVG